MKRRKFDECTNSASRRSRGSGARGGEDADGERDLFAGQCQRKPVVAEVKAVGGEVKNVKVGDKIVYKEYSTTDLKIDGTEYLIVREEDILATVV